MSRSLPTECDHGVTVDWGDFGPCQDCAEHDGEECPNFEQCPACGADEALRAAIHDAESVLIAAAIEWRKHVSLAAMPKFRPPHYSTMLADAVDLYRKVAES